MFTVVDQGVFLDNYVTAHIRMNLYAVNKFFVEMVYDSNVNRVVEVRSFKSGIQLDKYTAHINLD
ncbi:hypothetical protein [Flaviramulus basaltis]|nr:hypothetical protein [Flaviramulus basaltis]